MEYVAPELNGCDKVFELGSGYGIFCLTVHELVKCRVIGVEKRKWRYDDSVKLRDKYGILHDQVRFFHGEAQKTHLDENVTVVYINNKTFQVVDFLRLAIQVCPKLRLVILTEKISRDKLQVELYKAIPIKNVSWTAEITLYFYKILNCEPDAEPIAVDNHTLNVSAYAECISCELGDKSTNRQMTLKQHFNRHLRIYNTKVCCL